MYLTYKKNSRYEIYLVYTNKRSQEGPKLEVLFVVEE